MRQAFMQLGFSQLAATALTNEQDIGSCQMLKELTETEVDDVCKQIRKSGGAQGNGIPISVIAQSSLRTAAYLGRHLEKVSRPFTPANITMEAIRSIRDYLESEKNYENKVSKPKVDPRDYTKTFDDIQRYMMGCRGEKSKIPLAYVLRKDVFPAAPEDDPIENYVSIEEEMVERAPHTDNQNPPRPHKYYKDDNRQVYDLLMDIFDGTPTVTYLKPFSRTRNGRAAYYQAYEKHLGPAAIDVLASQAEKALQEATYKGDGRNWNFEKYVNLHVKNHNILERLKEEHDHVGIDERTKVRHFNTGITAVALHVPKGQILADQEAMTNFDRAVNIYKTFIANQPTSNKTVQFNVAGVESSNTTATVQDRYYTQAEYRKLTNEQKLTLKRLRAKRGGGSKEDSKRQKREIAALKSVIVSAVKTAMTDSSKSGEGESSGDESNEEGEDTNGDAPTNRTNPALTRQKSDKKNKSRRR